MSNTVTITAGADNSHEVKVQADSAISPTILQPGQSVTIAVDDGVRVSEGQEVAGLG